MILIRGIIDENVAGVPGLVGSWVLGPVGMFIAGPLDVMFMIAPDSCPNSN